MGKSITIYDNENRSRKIEINDLDQIVVDIGSTSNDPSSPLYVQITDGTNNAIVSADGQLHVVQQGKLDINNESVDHLGIGGIYTGDPTNISAYAGLGINVKADQAGTLTVQFSKNGSTGWFDGESYDIVANAQKFFTPPKQSLYYRLKYTNGVIAQLSFDLHVILSKTPFKWSSHNIAETITDQDDSELVTNVNKAKSDLTGSFENITSYREALNVNSAWVHRKIVNEIYHQHDGTTNLNSAASEGDISISVDDTTGFIVGDEIKLEEVVAGVGVQEIGVMTITIVAPGTPGTLTLDRPLGFDYTTAATVSNVETNMAVLGSLASPEIFEIDPPQGTIWQTTRVIFSMVHAAAGDDGKFGGIAALTNGVALRATTSAGRTVVFGNWKTNGDASLDMYDVTYTSKAPAGNNGTKGRWTFTKSEVVAELDGDASPVQKLEILIQDDLRGLISFNMKAQGRVFSP